MLKIAVLNLNELEGGGEGEYLLSLLNWNVRQTQKKLEKEKRKREINLFSKMPERAWGEEPKTYFIFNCGKTFLSKID